MHKTTRKELMKAGRYTFAPLHALESKALTEGAKCCYFALCSFTRKGSDSAVQPSEAELAQAYGKSPRSIRRHLAELRDKGFVAIEKQTGRPNLYVFLKPEIEGQMTIFDQGGRSEVTEVPEVARPDMARVARPDMARVEEPVLIKSESVERGRKEASKPTSVDTVDKSPRHAAAVAFLTQFLSRKAALKRVGEYGASKILYARKKLSNASGVRNRAGFVEFVLQQPADSYEVNQAAEEMLHQDRKSEQVFEAYTDKLEKRKAEKIQAKNISQWLDTQTDKKELLNRAANHAELTAGKGVTKNALQRMIQGYLTRERDRRGRNTDENLNAAAAIS